MPRHWLARPNRPLKPSSRSTVTPRCGHMNNTPDLTHLVVLVLRVFHISRVFRVREIISLGLTKVSPQMSPLSTQPTHWQHNQGAITLVFLSLVLWFPTLQIVVEGPTIPDKGGRGNPEVFARFRFVSELSKGSRNRIPCDFARQYLVSQARLSREGACILNCFPLPRCNSLKTADQRTCSEDLATGTWPSEPPASRQAVRMTQSNISYQSKVPNPSGTHT